MFKNKTKENSIMNRFVTACMKLNRDDDQKRL